MMVLVLERTDSDRLPLRASRRHERAVLKAAAAMPVVSARNILSSYGSAGLTP
jgi:hypothetical protein